MPRFIVILIVIVAVAVAALFLLSSLAREVPTQPVEVDVTNAAGR